MLRHTLKKCATPGRPTLSRPKNAAALSKMKAAWYLYLQAARILESPQQVHTRHATHTCASDTTAPAMPVMPHPMPSLIWLTISFVRYGERLRGVLGFPISAFSICSHSFLTCKGTRGRFAECFLLPCQQVIKFAGQLQETLTLEADISRHHLLCVWEIPHAVQFTRTYMHT